MIVGSPLSNQPNTTDGGNSIVPDVPPSVPAILDNQILVTIEDPEVPDIGVTNFRHLGGVGECRHDFHCIGSESCVNFRGNFM